MTEPNDIVQQGVIDPIKAAHVEIDQISKSRLFAGIEARLAQKDRVGWRGLRMGFVAGFAGLAVGAAIVFLVVGREPQEVGVARKERAILGLYSLEGPSSASEETLGKRVDHLVLEKGARVRARLGDSGRVTLWGPGELTVLGVSEKLIELDLESGVLVADFDRSLGKELVVRSGSMTTRVKGTVFLVDAASAGVAVLRGSVAVESAGREIVVGRKQHLDARAGTVADLTKRGEDVLSDHDKSYVPPLGGWGIVRVSEAVAVLFRGEGVGTGPLAAQLPTGEQSLEIGGRTVQVSVEAGATVPIALPPPEDDPDASHTAPPPETKAVMASPDTPSKRVADQPNSEDLYSRAEREMAAGNRAVAKELLWTIVRNYPRDLIADSARYDLARMAATSRDHKGARHLLDELERTLKDELVREPAALLRCQVEQEAKSDRARECLEDFRTRFPESPHRQAVLASLVSELARQGSCASAANARDDYRRLYPRGPHSQRLDEVVVRCRSKR